MKYFLLPQKVTRSFTLVETLVAITIIMIVILGPFDTLQNAANAAFIARDQLIANSLAQEGVEYVRSKRDNNYLSRRKNNISTPDFLGGLDGTTNGTFTVDCISNNCTVDPIANSAAICSGTGGACTPLYISSAAPYSFTQTSSGATQSIFTRSIRICYMQSDNTCTTTLSNEARLTVTMSWTTEGKPQSSVITEYLQNWL